MQAHQFKAAKMADKDRPDPALFDETYTPQDKGAHNDLTQFGRADHERPHMHRIEGYGRAAFLTGAGGSERLPAGKLADFARELAGSMTDDRRLVPKPVTAHHIQGAFQDEPHGHVALPDVEHDLPRSKRPCRAARKSLGCLDLACVKHREKLVAAGLDQAHRVSLLQPSLCRAAWLAFAQACTHLTRPGGAKSSAKGLSRSNQ